MIHVLQHGIARFDALYHPLTLLMPEWLRRRFDSVHYFRGIKSHLTQHGFRVEHSDVPFAASLPDRAAATKENVDRISKDNPMHLIHLICHSMAGLDGRYAIAKLGLKNVAVLSTIGTPHLGTAFADWGLSAAPGDPIIRALRPIISLEGLRALTTNYMREFNAAVESIEARNSTLYRTFAAVQPLAGVFTPLRASWKIIERAEGVNDGLVSLPSQLWKSHLQANECAGPTIKPVEQHVLDMPLDHLNQCGWWDRREPNRKGFELAVRAIYYGEIVKPVDHYF